LYLILQFARVKAQQTRVQYPYVQSKEIKMFSILTNTRNSNLNVAIAVAITLIVVLTFVVAPSIVALQPAPIPVTGSQDVNSATRSYIAWAEAADSERAVVNSATRSYIAWAQYLLGEKGIR
jgi:hypothetical protein